MISGHVSLFPTMKISRRRRRVCVRSFCAMNIYLDFLRSLNQIRFVCLEISIALNFIRRSWLNHLSKRIFNLIRHHIQRERERERELGSFFFSSSHLLRPREREREIYLLKVKCLSAMIPSINLLLHISFRIE